MKRQIAKKKRILSTTHSKLKVEPKPSQYSPFQEEIIKLREERKIKQETEKQKELYRQKQKEDRIRKMEEEAGILDQRIKHMREIEEKEKEKIREEKEEEHKLKKEELIEEKTIKNLKETEQRIKAQGPENYLEKKVESLIEQGYDEDEILSALLSLNHEERHVKNALKKVRQKRKLKEPKKEIISDKDVKVKTEVDDIYYHIKLEEKITIAELAAKLKMTPEKLRKWLEYLEKDGLITIKCRFGGKEFVKIKEEF